MTPSPIARKVSRADQRGRPLDPSPLNRAGRVLFAASRVTPVRASAARRSGAPFRQALLGPFLPDLTRRLITSGSFRGKPCHQERGDIPKKHERHGAFPSGDGKRTTADGARVSNNRDE